MQGRHRSQVREVINRNTVVTLALEQGFVAFLPVYDSGVDFILYRETDGAIRKVQLKGRWTIDRKYEGRDIWMAFPIGTDWYLVPHDDLVARAGSFLQTASWIGNGMYNVVKPPKEMIGWLARYRFAAIAEVAGEASSAGQVPE